MDGQPVAPTTTVQEDLTVAGQRKVNLIWEFTQAGIALAVVFSNMAASLFNVYNGKGLEVPAVLSNTLFLVVGFYFSRTNHQAIGGVGHKANTDTPYRGR